jgi:transposase
LQVYRLQAGVAAVHRNATVMSPLISPHARAAQQQLLLPHDPIHALGVDARRTGLLPTAAQQRPDTPVAVGLQMRHMGLNFLDQPGIKEIKELQRLLGKKTLEVEILKEAVEWGRSKNLIARSPLLPGDDR